MKKKLIYFIIGSIMLFVGISCTYNMGNVNATQIEETGNEHDYQADLNRLIKKINKNGMNVHYNSEKKEMTLFANNFLNDAYNAYRELGYKDFDELEEVWDAGLEMQIQIATNSKMTKFVKDKCFSKKTYDWKNNVKLKNIPANKTYYIRMRYSYKNPAGEVIYSNWTDTYKVKTKKVGYAGNVWLTNMENGLIMASWSKVNVVSGCTKIQYEVWCSTDKAGKKRTDDAPCYSYTECKGQANWFSQKKGTVRYVHVRATCSSKGKKGYIRYEGKTVTKKITIVR